MHVSFRQVKQEIIRRMQARVWPAGHIIPSEMQLVEEFDCSRATVNRAMRELADEGLIERKRKAGSRVAFAPVRHARLDIPLIRKEIEATGANYRYALVDRAVCATPPWLRTRLDFPLHGKVLHLRCLHLANLATYVFEDRWINIVAVPEVTKEDFSLAGPNEWLVNTVPFSSAEFSFFAEAANPEIAQFLSLNAGAPILVAERFTKLGLQPVTFARLSYGAGYRMNTRLGARESNLA